MEGVRSNWESILFRPIIHRVEELSGKACRGQDLDSIAIRVIADHSRAAAFLIADAFCRPMKAAGMCCAAFCEEPCDTASISVSNEPFLYDSAGVVVNIMSSAYPELTEMPFLSTR